MRVTIITISVMLLLGISGTLLAQGRRGQHQPPPPPNNRQIQKMVNDLSQRLKLTEEQEAKVRKLFEEHFESANKLHKQRKMAPEKMESMRKEFESKVKALLNDEQKKAFDKFMQEQRRRGAARRSQGWQSGKLPHKARATE